MLHSQMWDRKHLSDTLQNSSAPQRQLIEIGHKDFRPKGLSSLGLGDPWLVFLKLALPFTTMRLPFLFGLPVMSWEFLTSLFSLKAHFTLKIWTLSYPFFPPCTCLKGGGGAGEGRNKSLLLKLLHDSLDQGTPKGNCLHPGFSFISFRVISLLAGEKGSGPKPPCIFRLEKCWNKCKHLEGKNKPTLKWDFLFKKKMTKFHCM